MRNEGQLNYMRGNLVEKNTHFLNLVAISFFHVRCKIQRLITLVWDYK